MASYAAISQIPCSLLLVLTRKRSPNLNSIIINKSIPFHQSQIGVSIILPTPQFRSAVVVRTPAATHTTDSYSSPPEFELELELTPDNVNSVLDDVRPYLISDGGDVQVVSVVDGVVSLKLQGACESCPSSTTTMKMGIERRLKEKFGDAIKEVCQVYEEQPSETSVEAVNNHLEILRPAIKNFGGSVEVLSVESGECIVKYNGPASIGSGVRDAIKEKFPDIATVVLTQ